MPIVAFNIGSNRTWSYRETLGPYQTNITQTINERWRKVVPMSIAPPFASKILSKLNAYRTQFSVVPRPDNFGHVLLRIERSFRECRSSRVWNITCLNRSSIYEHSYLITYNNVCPNGTILVPLRDQTDNTRLETNTHSCVSKRSIQGNRQYSCL